MNDTTVVAHAWGKFWASVSLGLGGFTLAEAHAVVAFMAAVVGLCTGLWLLGELIYKRLIKQIPIGDTKRGDL